RACRRTAPRHGCRSRPARARGRTASSTSGRPERPVRSGWAPAPRGGGAGAPGEKRLVSSHSARGAKLWDLVDAAGKVANVVAVPVSFPPARLEHGRFVCGMFTPGEAVDYPWRHELKSELKAIPGGYEADPFALGLEGLEFI